MHSWAWSEVAGRFMDLTATSDDDELNQACEEDALYCQELLQRVIEEEQRTNTCTVMDGVDEQPSEDGDEASEFPEGTEPHNTVSYIQPPVADEFYEVDGPGRYAFSTSENEDEVGGSMEFQTESGDESIAGEYDNYG